MSGAPVVSVVTPTKNRLALLRETMDSVAAQTFPDWEHLIVDDGSNDGTAEEVMKRAAADPRIRYIPRTGDKPGANVCRNQGVAESRSDLIVFLDSDDLLSPECLERRASVMGRNQDLDFVVFQTGVFLQRPGDLGRQLDSEMLGDDLLRFLFFECPWQTTAPTWRKEAFRRIKGFDESLPSWQDIDLHVRAIAAGLRYLRFPEVDHHVRWQNEPGKVSMEQRRSPAHLEAASALLEKFEGLVREGPGMNWVRQRALCSLYFGVAQLWVSIGRLATALQSWGAIRRRRLGSELLYVSGALLLVTRAMDCRGQDTFSDRLINRWRGWMRLKTNPQLLKH